MTTKTQKATASIGIVLILSLGIFIAAQYEKPYVPVVHVFVPVQSQTTSTSTFTLQKKHVYNPSPSVPCNIGKDKRCSAVFTVNGKRTDYSEQSKLMKGK